MRRKFKVILIEGPKGGGFSKTQYKAVPGGIQFRVWLNDDQCTGWQDCDFIEMVRLRNLKSDIIEPLTADIVSLTRNFMSWSVEQLADYFKMSPRTIQNWECGRFVRSGPLLLLYLLVKNHKIGLTLKATKDNFQ